MTRYHVTKSKDGSWGAKKEGAERVSAKANTQKEAEALAKELCKNNGGGEVVIHTPKGTIRDSDTVAPGNESSTKDEKH